jgi:hypothetical protein
VATVFAPVDGLSCDTIPADSFLCRHDRLRLAVRLVVYIGVVLIIARHSSAIVRTIRLWCVVPLVVAVWGVFEWRQAHPEFMLHFWAPGVLLIGWAISICSVLACQRRPADRAGSVTL